MYQALYSQLKDIDKQFGGAQKSQNIKMKTRWFLNPMVNAVTKMLEADVPNLRIDTDQRHKIWCERN